MADNYPVVNVVEQSVNNQVNSMLGNNDVNLKTIFKLSIMDELGQVDREDLENVINKIKENNKTEAYYINKEYKLTYDLSGNVVTCKGNATFGKAE
jgi:DNA-binding MltR family transcriptional regulator